MLPKNIPIIHYLLAAIPNQRVAWESESEYDSFVVSSEITTAIFEFSNLDIISQAFVLKEILIHVKKQYDELEDIHIVLKKLKEELTYLNAWAINRPIF